MISEIELLHVMALQRVPQLGGTLAKKLIQHIGSAEGVFKEKKSALLKIDGFGSFRLKDLQLRPYLDEAERELSFIRKHQIEYRYFLDENYPDRLRNCWDGPLLYFQKGNIDIKGKKVLSIVGTRRSTQQGNLNCEKLLEDLAVLEPVIVSGFAYGIDICAQKKALDLGLQTIGCLAHGLNQIYPRTHEKYMEAIELHGGFITEFWSDDPFDRTNFLKRNRIIAGLGEATVVIESAEKGGSLVTADIAHSYHRDVFAMPGRISDVQSVGCNNLIKTQKAHMLTTAADLIYIMDWNLEAKVAKQTQLFLEFTAEEQVLVDFFKQIEKSHLDEIAIGCKLPIQKTASLLLSLELKGVVRPLPGKQFEWI